MDTLKNALTPLPVLVLYYFGGHITFDTDACSVQMFCVLLQKHPDGATKPIGYFSCLSTNSEQLYHSMKRDCLIIVWSILFLRPYPKIRRFTIRFNKDALKWILKFAVSTERPARWRLFALEFAFDVIHSVGSKHQAANGLSRLFTTRKHASLL